MLARKRKREEGGIPNDEERDAPAARQSLRERERVNETGSRRRRKRLPLLLLLVSVSGAIYHALHALSPSDLSPLLLLLLQQQTVRRSCALFLPSMSRLP